MPAIKAYKFNDNIVPIDRAKIVKQLKGSSRPINCEDDRKAMLEALECVDEVIIFDEPTPRELILRVKPHAVTKGGDYTPEDVVGYDLGPEVIIIPLRQGHSTTAILEKINA